MTSRQTRRWLPGAILALLLLAWPEGGVSAWSGLPAAGGARCWLRTDALLRDALALQALAEARALLADHRYRDARGALDLPALRRATPLVRGLAEDLREDLVSSRLSFLRYLAGKALPTVLRDLVREKVRPRYVPLVDVLAWARRELVSEAFSRLAAERLSRYDDVTHAEAKALFASRRADGSAPEWRRVSYGSGTWLRTPPPPVPAAGGRPPTRDEWWTASPAGAREEFLFAHAVEHAGLFELGPSETRTCILCGGTGWIRKTVGRPGLVISYVCTRCWGLKEDRIVTYR